MTAAAAAAPLPTPSIRRRLASMAYEAILLVSVVFFGFFVPNVVLGIAFQVALPGGLLALNIIGVVGFYLVWFWRRDGRTLAMKTWKIRLVAADGSKPGMDRLLLRFLLAWPSLMLCGAGVAWALFDPDRQFLHDRLSGTRLVFAG